MLLVDRADRRGDALLQAPDRLVLRLVAAIALARRREAPVGFVDEVVAADPRLVPVAGCELLPQRNRLALIFRAFPQRGLRRITVGNREVVALPARRGVEVDRKSTRLNSSH